MSDLDNGQGQEDAGGQGDAHGVKRKRGSDSDQDQDGDHGDSRPRLDPEARQIAEHYNSIEDKGLAARNRSSIFFMRNLNNWIKTILINEYAMKINERRKFGERFDALDLCCGKGGDLFKWNDRRIRLSQLIAVDIAEQSIEHCKDRFKRMRNCPFKAEFRVADCGLERLRNKYPDPSMKFDMVSCQFAFHYAFQSLARAEMFFRNASECLRPGGYFIGTIPNSNRIISRALKSPDGKFGNDVYDISLEFDPREKIPLFGAKYRFKLEGVVDCPEYLVHFPTLVRLAEKYDLKLVSSELFEDFVRGHRESHRFLLDRMKCLEYFPEDGNRLIHPKVEYPHAEKYMKDNRERRVRRVMTMSQCEWEVICLYRTFAFEKIKRKD